MSVDIAAELLRLAGAPNQRHRPLHPAELAATQAAVREHELTHAVVRRFEAESLRSDAGFGARSIDDTLPESEDI